MRAISISEKPGEVKALAGKVEARSIGARMDSSSSGVSSMDIGGTVVRTSSARRAGSHLHETEHGSRRQSARWKCLCR